MTAASDVAPGPILPAALRRYSLAPAEGWLTLGFTILLALTVAWSFDDAAWVLGNRDWGDFYAWGTLLAALIGFAGAKVGWPRWVTHLVGAVGAALVLPIMVGSILEPGGSLGEMYRATSDSVVQAWVDLGLRGQAVTTQTGHHLLVIGAICWAVGQFAAYAVFGHRRPLDAVIVVGMILLGNMVVTANDQIWFLVIFSLAALCVLARTHAFDEESTWIRRRIGDGSVVRSLYLRGGAVFIAVAVIGSLVLTTSASSAPLAGFWSGFDQTLIEWGRRIQQYLPVGGNSALSGSGFSDRATISGVWESRDNPALTIRVPADDETKYYWRAAAYDSYQYGAWVWTAPGGRERGPGARVLQGTAEEPTSAYARRQVTFDVQVDGPVGNFVVSPLDPLVIDAATRLRIVGGASWFSALETDAKSYQVTATVPLFTEDGSDNSLTRNRLRVAGTDYPDEIKRLYLQKPDGFALGPAAQELLLDIVANAESNAPFDIAQAIEDRLSTSDEFEYTSDIRGLCGNRHTVDCFAETRRGYCVQYATTMVMFLRSLDIPARFVQGYLPSERDAAGRETILTSAAHAWVEVYFPGYGWYSFDPTGGGRSQTPDLPLGPQVTPRPSAAPSFGSVGELPRDDERGTQRPNVGAGGTSDGRGPGDNAGLFIAIAVLLLVVVGGAAFVAWQRGPRTEVNPDIVWRGIARTASRFGFGPRPQQTVYEYAGALGEVLPGSRPELQTVARAKVEVAYGRRELGADALRSLRDAQRRLRVGLLRLALRRADRKRRRR